MLPLALGMRVALTDHVDRSTDKLLLRGCVGHVHSWVWGENDRLPTVVYVKFIGAAWQLDGIDEPGVYPIEPVQREWFLDRKRKPKVLKIMRRQLPLTPAFSMTAHTSQGKTLPAVLLDLNVDKRVNATFGTVAASRVRHREDVLILRPFPHFLFHRGAVEGPRYLLATLRGESIDWEAYRDAKNPAAPCSTCNTTKPLHQFDHKNWDKIRANQAAMCLKCLLGPKAPPYRKMNAGAAKRLCNKCLCHKIDDAFPPAQLHQTGSNIATYCLACCKAFVSLTCAKCSASKLLEAFDGPMVTMPPSSVACKACQKEASKQENRDRFGWITCRTCRTMFPRCEDYRGPAQQQQRCLNCMGHTKRRQGEQTCRNPACGKKWSAQQAQESRIRLCPECRRAAPSKQKLGLQ